MTIQNQQFLNQKQLKNAFERAERITACCFKEHQKDLVKETIHFVHATLHGEGTGHDWWHIHRVYTMVMTIAQQEQGANLFIVALAALLHDIADWKFHNGDDSVGPRVAGEWLASLKVDAVDITHIQEIIKTLSFKGAGDTSKMRTLEGMIVQDADRLDALGAIGIARCFAYGGSKHNMMYDPLIPIQMHSSFEEYKTSKGTSLNHFYEKLFLLQDRMNTQTARTIAQQRHAYMQDFVQRFLQEWGGQDLF